MRSWIAAALLIGSLVILFIAAGCNNTSTPRPDVNPPANKEAVITPAVSEKPVFVGNDACIECHAEACKAHSASRHNLTLLAADPKSLGKLAPPIGPIRGTPYVIARNGDTLMFGLASNPQFRQPLDIAFGSGKTGITFASFVHSATGSSIDMQGLMRVRMSWFPHTRKWLVTPGDEKLKPADSPTTLTGTRGRGCVACHVSTMDEVSMVPEKRFYGVGCEACHGPASAHIAAARIKGSTDLKIQRLTSLSSQKLSELCGKCHGSPEPVKRSPGTQISVREAGLHPPAGLADSTCFKKSGGKISCLTCHTSHDNVRQDPASYESVCLSCHAASGNSVTNAGRVSNAHELDEIKSAAPIKSKPCSVSPTGHCLPCHMSSDKVFLGGGVATDHCIRRKRPKTEPNMGVGTDSLMNN